MTTSSAESLPDSPTLPSEPVQTSTAASLEQKSPRKKLFAYLLFVVLFAATVAGLYWFFVSSRHANTDNAYVVADLAPINPEISAKVVSVNVKDTQAVKKGDILVVLDDQDAKLTLQEKEAELSKAMRKVQGYVANDEGLGSQIQAHQAEQAKANAQVIAAQNTLLQAKQDLDRRQALAQSGFVSAESLTHLKTALLQAQANLQSAQAAEQQSLAGLRAAQSSLKANNTLSKDTQDDLNPELVLAQTQRDIAKLNLSRTVIRAPIDGVVAKRQVQVGQLVNKGAPLMVIVPLQNAYVNANFKEIQIAHIKPGQEVELISDLYGSDVVYKGIIEGFAAGSGSAFAAIPAQNATGNWIKVVQRLPVRIRLDPKQLSEHPLQVGLSMSVSVNTDSK